MMKNIVSIVLVAILSLGIILSCTACGSQDTNVEPVKDVDMKNARILFLEYTVRYNSADGNKEYIVVGYVLPDDDTLKTMNIVVQNVVFVKENIAEIRTTKQDDFVTLYDYYLYINEEKFLELLK